LFLNRLPEIDKLGLGRNRFNGKQMGVTYRNVLFSRALPVEMLASEGTKEQQESGEKEECAEYGACISF
jgi:hypothetical protein